MPLSLRQRITNWRWFPKSLLGRLTAYILALDIFLYLLQRLLHLFGPRGGSSLEGWIDFLTFIAAVLVFLVFLRWLRNDLMWRLRNRLIVTYVFMAVVPILLLVAMAGIAGYIFAGQFATFIVTGDIKSELGAWKRATGLWPMPWPPNCSVGSGWRTCSLRKAKRRGTK